MRVTIGSKNKVKIDAVREMLADYPMFGGAEVEAVETASGVSAQPKNLEEIVRGAENRAKGAFKDCDYSFGIEGGFANVPRTKTGFMQFEVCVIYDGDNFHLGLSSGFEAPREVMRLILEEGLDLSKAANRVGLHPDENIGASIGIINPLTKGRLSRKEYTKEAIRMALIHLENAHLY